jgi:hypothetical protein
MKNMCHHCKGSEAAYAAGRINQLCIYDDMHLNI